MVYLLFLRNWAKITNRIYKTEGGKMLKVTIKTLVFLLVFLFSPMSMAGERPLSLAPDLELSPAVSAPLSYDRQSGLSYRFAGSEEQGEGSLQFFLKPDFGKNSTESTGGTGDSLSFHSRLGIQYKFRF